MLHQSAHAGHACTRPPMQAHLHTCSISNAANRQGVLFIGFRMVIPQLLIVSL